MQAAADAYRAMGATIVDVELPLTDVGISTYYVIAPAEASSNLARFDGIRYGHRAKDVKGLRELYTRSRSEGFGPEVKRRIEMEGAIPAGNSPQEFAKFVEAEIVRWRTVVQYSGAKPE